MAVFIPNDDGMMESSIKRRHKFSVILSSAVDVWYFISFFFFLSIFFHIIIANYATSSQLF